MSVHLLQKVQQLLGYPELKKIDPNNDNLSAAGEPTRHIFSQAAVPAVLTAMYKYVQSDAGAEEVLRGDSSTNWVGKIFHGHYKDAVEKIQSFAADDTTDTTAKMNTIAVAAAGIVKQNLPAAAGIRDVKVFFLNQRNNILPYLPPELKLGDLLNDDTVDDNVNKMEGPVSSLIKGIGSAFSNPVTGDEVKRF